jgi:hypothetical protein
MTEHPLSSGHHGSLVFVQTNLRLIIRHVSAVPTWLPTKKRLRDLMRVGWSANEIARMYDCSTDTVLKAARRAQ